ncbi:aldehyde dehydrogenase family protein [Pseudonocardia sp. KRD-184]|uniref:Aldehyde dehydrogenase n=1 Tax=Pseudonocardia oceani TaxID=2792013 RepID=A0ABS6U5U8_9PSEU|nr:aldehyde dehydrogenase family protein [Pseudonocardia oceani]MBW0092359.1 aldehyde dehydrogenase family protein [Pseudonocardia oceani]MBW0097596.1 aldehyde dehydrogenase family protein [Pseudonocardia oceani]MBW0110276.1 aldehyde dehydrogenase family protein [Pseudonocardia oceani]MBW0124302.1 aldehyde dehydrogenase family protein [Pseudonocardia oceani]MBW0127596.1 aldehyde dehydrogenase family protein [Pseudonocardia oceani]
MTTTQAPALATFESLDPRTGAVVGTYPVHGAADVEAAVARAADAATWWAGLGFDGRRALLVQWRRALVKGLDALARIVVEETGKPFDDARLELVLAIDHLDWAAKHAEKVLGTRRVSSGLLMANQAATLTYAPLGVVGVIGPWNYPVFTPMGSIAYALAAGNAVVFKPSELTPGVGVALADSLAEIVGGRPVLQVVTGSGETGAALCRAAGVAKVAFTGSTATGKRVMATCAETLTPVLIECGGKDPLIVDADADLEAAADAAVWGGMSNAGQTCVGVERVYVLDAVAQEFTDKVVAKANALTAGAEFGPMTMSSQTEVVRRHVADALEKGGTAVVGGADSAATAFVEPVVILDVPEDSTAVTEETFGPLLVVNRVPDVDEAVRRANATGYGLGATVFSKARGAEIAARLRCGMVSVNSVISFAGIPALPFGGVGDSGFGRIHGEDGLREFTRPQAVARQRFALPIAVTSFRRTSAGMGALLGLVRVLRGR